MNANETALLDPFDVSTPDEATELTALTRALELAEGFRLLLVRCNQIPQRERLMEEVRARLPKHNIQTIFFREPMEHLLDAVQGQLAAPMPDAVFISGLEFSLPVAAEAHATPLIANLNASRNSFAQTLRCPMVLWVPEYVLKAIVQGAPDFFSIRSGVYFFVPQPTEIARLSQDLSTRELWAVASLSKREKQDRIVAIERLLADYEFLPDNQRDRYAECRLLGQLGEVFYTLGNYDKALGYFDRALKMAEMVGDIKGVASSLHRIGMVQQSLRYYETALNYYERSLKIKEGIGGEASLLHAIGTVQEARGNHEAALDYYERSLKVAEEMGHKAGVAASFGQIGNVQSARGNHEAALDYYERSLEIAEEIGNVAGVATSLYNIAIVQQILGNYEAALDCSQRSLRMREGLGDVARVASSQGQMSRLYVELGHYAEAFGLLLKAHNTFVQLQSPYARTAANNLKTLRGKWKGFDEAWQETTSEEVPRWLLQDEGATE